jgi:hypothetical protein
MDTTIMNDSLESVRNISDQLGDRRSILCLARGLLVGFFGIVMLGVTVKLFIDSERLPYAGFVTACVDAAAWSVSLVSLYRWRRHAGEEAALFERLREEQRRLGLAPSSSADRLTP